MILSTCLVCFGMRETPREHVQAKCEALDPAPRARMRLQVVSPRVRAFLYTWAHRTTAEGEAIPFRCDPMALRPSDQLSLVLPLTLEHDIDERSPLYGHTYDSLTVRACHSRCHMLAGCPLPRILMLACRLSYLQFTAGVPCAARWKCLLCHFSCTAHGAVCRRSHKIFVMEVSCCQVQHTPCTCQRHERRGWGFLTAGANDCGCA
jgi:hypothetical protein